MLRKIFAVVIILITIAFALTGVAVVGPKTIKIIKQPVGYLDGKAMYRLITHINDGSGPNFVWKWPTGKVKAVIDIGHLNFQKKVAFYSLDQETGDPKDSNKILAVDLSGTIKVENWEVFFTAFGPEGTYLENVETLEIGNQGIINNWKSNLDILVAKVIGETAGVQLKDAESYFQYAVSLVDENKDLTSPELVKSFIKENEPWIWAFGPSKVAYYKANPEALSNIAMGTPGNAELYTIVVSANFLDNFQEFMEITQKQQKEIRRIIKPELVSKADLLVDKFIGFLKESQQSLSSLDPNISFEQATEQFFEKETASQDEQLAFLILVQFEREKASLLARKEFIESIWEYAIADIKTLPQFNDEILDYYWQLAIKAALENPKADQYYLTKEVIRPFLTSSVLWNRAIKVVNGGGGLFWSIENSSSNFGEFPLFIEGKIDPDFYRFHKTNEAQ